MATPHRPKKAGGMPILRRVDPAEDLRDGILPDEEEAPRAAPLKEDSNV